MACSEVRPLPRHLLGVRDARRSPVGWRACVRVRRGGHAVPQLQFIPTRIIRRARRGASTATRAWTTDMTDRLEHFPYVWCDTCEKIQPMIFDVMPADDQNDHDAADIVCNECKSIVATLHAARDR